MGLFFKKKIKSVANTTGDLLGDVMSRNSRNATNEAVDGMNLFRQKVNSSIVQNGQFSAQKGNLFEYIEAAKFNVDAAKMNSSARAVVTDAVGDPHAVADLYIQENGHVVKEIQAKFIQSYHKGHDTSAAKSVFAQTGAENKGWGQYDGMDRLIRKQENYNKNGSLLEEAKTIAKKRADSNGIYSDYYDDVYEHLTDETKYKNNTSGGTTIEEVQDAHKNPEAYLRKFEHQVVAEEMKCSAVNMAKANFVTTGLVSGITHMLQVYNDEQEIVKALQEIGVDTLKSGIRGGATGALSTAIRYQGIKAGSNLLSDSTAATVMAGGVIDGGVAIYKYAIGEIDEKELTNQIVDTTAKATSTVYFTKAISAIFGKAVNPIVPMAVYTTASYVVTCTREIIKNAELNTEQYERAAALLQDSTLQLKEYHLEFQRMIEQCESRQRTMLDNFINNFEYNLATGENYDQAVYSIVQFANEAGIMLQHTSFEEFSDAMRSKDPFVLG